MNGRASAAKILVVEDDPACAEVLCAILADAGHATAWANNGQTALQRLWAEPFDVLVTDIIMAERDGFELMQLVRREFPRIGVIAVSGLDPFQIDVLKVSRLLGAHAALRKPCDPEVLLATVADLLRQRADPRP
jgi:CheY-like chemotaxis protein